MHSISNELFNQIMVMYPIFEVQLPSTVYFKDKSISTAPLVFTELPKWITVRTLQANERVYPYILMNLFVTKIGGSMLIQQKSKEYPIYKLSDNSCYEFFKYNIKIQTRTHTDGFYEYNMIEINRRVTINNIINS